MAFLSKDLLSLNSTMRKVVLVVFLTVLISLIFLWRQMAQQSLGQNAAYKAPMNIYTKAEKLMVRGKFEQALKRYNEAAEMLRKIPEIDLSDDFYYAIVNNAIGTVHLRIGVYGEGDDEIKSRADLGRNRDELLRSLGYFRLSVDAYQKWLAAHRPGAESIAALQKSRIGVKEDKIELEPFERYERALSVSLTNCAMVHRYMGEYKVAQEYYTQALALWPENRTASANLESMQEVLAEATGKKVDEKAEPVQKSLDN
ncbi:MAG: tetratricopeptide repeat protein [Deltaproteobacteria bacterium]|nr:tetratricopeptide repeat protein [Deltaproteobacteria bacterium]